MSTDFDTLQAEADALVAQANAKIAEAKSAREAARVDVLAKMKADMQRFSISYADLGAKVVGGKRKTNGSAGRPKADAAPKYRSPDGKSTWSGLGRLPNWIKGLNTDGRKALLIVP